MKKVLFVAISALLLSACQQRDHRRTDAQQTLPDSLYLAYIAKGKQIVRQSFAALSTRLQQAIVAHGSDSALAFCSVHALPITDSLSHQFQATISRTASRYRNRENAPDQSDQLILNHFSKLQLEIGNLPDTLLVNARGEYVYLAPIVTLPACLQCHGAPESEIKPQTLALIQSLYPEDRAIGFREGELRGLWKVKFIDTANVGAER